MTLSHRPWKIIREKNLAKVKGYTEKAMAPYSSTLAWRIPGTGEHGGLPSTGLHRVDLAEAAEACGKH